MRILTVIMVGMFIISLVMRPAILVVAFSDLHPLFRLLFSLTADVLFVVPVTYGLFHLARRCWLKRKTWRWTRESPFCPVCGQELNSQKDADDHRGVYHRNIQRRTDLRWLFLTLGIAVAATNTIPFAIAASTDEATPKPSPTPTSNSALRLQRTYVPAEYPTVVIRVATPTPRIVTPTPTPPPTATIPPQEDLDLFRDLLLDDALYQVANRCYHELGGTTGIQALVDAYEGLATKNTTEGWIIEYHGPIPAHSQKLLNHNLEAVEAELHFEASLARLAITLRGQGFDIPTDPILRDQQIGTVLFREPFTDTQWLAIRKDAHLVLDADIAFSDARLEYYRILLPGCGVQ